MGRAPCCDKANVKKGPWSPEEDAKLKEYMEKHGTGGIWIALPQKVGLRRCGKSCRLRWLNYLRPNIKHGEFSEDEDRIICTLFASIGSRWSIIASHLPGRTDNDIKNYWNTKLKKKLLANMTPISTQYQKRPNQATTFSLPSDNNYSFLQNPSIMASPLHPHETPSPYDQCGNSNSCITPFKSFPRVYEPINPPTFTTLISSDITPLDGFVGRPFHGNYNQVKKENNSLLMFGGEAISCSTTSDGSCTTNPISHVKDQNLFFQSYFSDGVDEINQKILFGNNDGYSSANGCLSENNPLDHSIEEIKQLISSDNNRGNNLNFFLDHHHEIKTEQVMDY